MSDPPLKQNNPAFWTPEERTRHRLRGEAHAMCKAGKFEEARLFCLNHNLPWPPFKKSPTKIDGRSLTSGANGAKSKGAPLGNTNGAGNHGSKAVEPTTLVEALSTTLLHGGSAAIQKSATLGEVCDSDRRALKRLCGLSVEEFNARLGEKLGMLADELADSLRADLAAGKLKPGEKAFPMAISIDKRNILDGRAALASAAVNIQVNNFGGGISRADLLARLAPTNITPAKPAVATSTAPIDLPPST